MHSHTKPIPVAGGLSPCEYQGITNSLHRHGHWYSEDVHATYSTGISEFGSLVPRLPLTKKKNEKLRGGGEPGR